MGLDMFVYQTDASNVDRDVLVNVKLSEQTSDEIAYFRKLNNLHGWMEDLWESRGGRVGHESFNAGENVRLLPEDLDKLEQQVAVLQPKQGFFFGWYQPMDAEMIAEVLNFVQKARDAIAAGKAVFYTSWW